MRTRSSRTKKVGFIAVACVACVLGIELVLRVVFAFSVGPSVLLYGTRFERRQIRTTKPEERTARFHENVVGAYSKYFPNQVRNDYDPETGETFRVTINDRGFRGRDFDERKTPGVVRVVTLGASSTFGFYSRDHQTYPYYLQQILNRSCRGERSFEVINLGVPHLPSNQILALFLAEALPLEPDVVTFYEGINDSYYDGVIEQAVTRPMPKRHLPTRLRRNAVMLALSERLVFVAWIDRVILERFSQYSRAELDAHTSRKSDFFLLNVSRIREECTRRGIVFIVGTQQAKSSAIPPEKMRGLSYGKEAGIIRKKLLEQGRIGADEFCFLAHARLMEDLSSWAYRTSTPLVDVIRATDRDRDVLVTYVHLNPRGNRLVAAAFADEILAHTCPI